MPMAELPKLVGHGIYGLQLHGVYLYIMGISWEYHQFTMIYIMICIHRNLHIYIYIYLHIIIVYRIQMWDVDSEKKTLQYAWIDDLPPCMATQIQQTRPWHTWVHSRFHCQPATGSRSARKLHDAGLVNMHVCVWKNITSHYIMILQGNTLHFQHVLHFLTLRRIAFCDIALGWTTLNTYMLIYWHILTLWRYSAAHSIPFDSIPFNSILAELWWFTNLKIAVVIRPFGDD